MPRKKTAFDSYFDQRMAEPEFADVYREARVVIDSTDALVRALDEARLLGGMSKAELARHIEARPEVVRRLFTAPTSNPTLDTVLKLASALAVLNARYLWARLRTSAESAADSTVWNALSLPVRSTRLGPPRPTFAPSRSRRQKSR